jgi:hypothetical protein
MAFMSRAYLNLTWFHGYYVPSQTRLSWNRFNQRTISQQLTDELKLSTNYIPQLSKTSFSQLKNLSIIDAPQQLNPSAFVLGLPPCQP